MVGFGVVMGATGATGATEATEATVATAATDTGRDAGVRLQGRLVRTLCLLCAGASLTMGVLIFPVLLAPESPRSTVIFWTGVFATTTCLTGYFASRRGHHQFAAWTIIATCCTAPVLGSVSHASLLAFAAIGVGMAALLPSPRPASVLAFVAAALPLAAALLGTVDWASAAIVSGSNLLIGLAFTVVRGTTDRQREVEVARHRAERDAEVLRRQLVESRKLESLGQLAGGVAHDLNNYLTVILGGCDLVDPDGRDGDLQHIRDASEGAARLVSQLLAYARRQPRKPVVLDLCEVTRRAEPILRQLLREDVQLDIVARGPSLAEADPTQLEQVLLNLVANAHNALPTGGHIQLEVAPAAAYDAAGSRPAGRFVTLVARDDGPGMPPEVAERVLEPFFTTGRPGGDGAGKGSGRGTGLGLATVHGIVSQSGGFVRVDSAPGEGSAFTVYLPEYAGTRARAPVPDAAATADHRVTGSVLVVDDEDAVRQVVHRALSRRGHHVLSASSPEAALELCRSHPGKLDLVITDVVMPQMRGPELARRIAEHRPDAAVLYMSGYTAGSEVPADRLIEKPFSTESLCARVDAALRAASTPDAPGAPGSPDSPTPPPPTTR